MAKATASKSTTKSRGSGKRELIKPIGDARYIRRDAKGRIKESDDVGRSLGAGAGHCEDRDLGAAEEPGF